MPEHARARSLSATDILYSFEPAALEQGLQELVRALHADSALSSAARHLLPGDAAPHAIELMNLLQRGAQGDWVPLSKLLKQLGETLASAHADYSVLQRITPLLFDALGAPLQAAVMADPSRAFTLMRTLQEAMDVALNQVGCAFLHAREAMVREEGRAVELALRSSEIRFKSLFEAGIIGILICDVDGNIQEANDAFLNMVGYTREEVSSRAVRWADMTPPEWRAHDDAAIEQLKVRGATSTWEKEYLRKDGSRVPILVGVAMLNQVDCIAFVLDITERRRLEALRVRSAELEAQNARVQESSRLKNEFLANMSHELRTPLNSIIGFADVLYDREVPTDSPKHHELIGDILRSGRHLLQLINDVLDLAKIEAGKLDFHPEAIDLGVLINEVASILRTTAHTKRLNLTTHVDPLLPEVTLDPSRLKQVLYNYVSNALKFTEQGGQVAIRALREGENAFRIEVTDTGIGIAPHDIPRLFIEFQQLDAGTAKRHAGTGLGLALTKRIVEAQSGSVGVVSKAGEGSTFYAVLPCSVTHTTLDPAELLPMLNAKSSARVLVVEDDANDRRLLTRILGDAGYAVDQAATGAQAVEACAQQAYDAITLDLLLPDLTGLEVLRNIRLEGKNQTTPIVIVSVVAEQGVIGGYPVHDYLSKPINSYQLLTTLRRAQVPTQADRKIWVIDDDPAAVKLMCTVLEQLGYQVKAMPDASTALSHLTLERPSAIVLDLMMPDVDGFGFLAQLRRAAEHDDVPVIVWTNKDLTPEDHKRLHSGAQAVVLKGYDRNQSLTQQMRVLLQRTITARQLIA